MPIKVLKLNIPSDVFIALNETETQLLNDMKLFTAIWFFQMKKLTLGKAARFIGISKYEFEKILSQNRIPISNLDIEDIENDIRKLEKI